MKRSWIKSKPRKTSAIRKAAKGQECTLGFAGICLETTDTTVLCHSNYLTDGRGMGLKSPDQIACFGCFNCHEVLDGRVPMPIHLSAEKIESIFKSAVVLTHVILKRMGLIEDESND